MRSYKTDKDSANSEFYDYNKSVIITFDVEYIVLVSNIVG